MKKTDLLFQMLEHPDDYSEDQWQDVLADEECRELYSLMAKTKSATQATQVTDEEIDAEWQRLAHHKHLTATVIPLWRKIAAAAAIMIALFGFTYAAVRTGFFGVEKLLTPKDTTHVEKKTTTKEQETKIEEVLTEEEQVEEVPVKVEPHLYDNVPLEQMLNELSAYYHVDVEYTSDDVRSLRLYYQWEPDFSLDKVVDMLSHFETFSIHREGNKLIVEPSSQEGKQ